MNILEATKEKIAVEMTREEFRDLDSVVMTAGLSWRALDKAPYDLSEAKLKRVTDAFVALVDELEAQRVSRKAKLLTKS
jgi:hypothetical protein